MKKIIYFLFFVILLSSFCFAERWHEWEFTDNFVDKSGLANMTEYGSLDFNNSKFGKGIYFDGNNEGACYDDDDTNYFDINSTQDFSVCAIFWKNTVHHSNAQHLVNHQESSPQEAWSLVLNTESEQNLFMELKDGSNSDYHIFDYNSDMGGQWFSTCGVFNRSGDCVHGYIDGVLYTECSDITGYGNIENDVPLTIGGWIRDETNDCNSAEFIGEFYQDDVGIIDEVFFIDRMLTVSEIIEFNNTGDIVSITGGEVEENPTITIYSNITETSYNFSEIGDYYFFSWNTTQEYTSNIMNCSIIFNNTIVNETYLNLDTSNNIVSNFSIIDWQNNLTLGINCSNNNASDYNTYFLEFDVIIPELILSSTLTNNSIFNDTEWDSEELNFNITSIDNNLYAYNRTIINTDTGENLSQIFIENINETEYIDYIEFDLDFGEDTNFKVVAQNWDSHTGQKLSKSPSLDKNNKLIYKKLKFYCPNANSLSYQLETDRIKPKIKFKDKGKNYCYYEGKNFKKIKNSNYPNHFVDFENKIWIDDYDGNIVQEEKGKLKLILDSDKKDYVLNSIGDLNTNKKEWFFSVDFQSTSLQEAEALNNIASALSSINNNLIYIILLIFTLVSFVLSNFNIIDSRTLNYASIVSSFSLILHYQNSILRLFLIMITIVNLLKVFYGKSDSYEKYINNKYY